jgi:HAD superfamily hydrolase (TIGR01509 family)
MIWLVLSLPASIMRGKTSTILALIFDFDGLILDTELPIYRSWQAVYRAHGQSLPLSAWVDFIGRAPDTFDPAKQLETLLGRPLDRERLHLRRAKHELELIKANPILPGVEDYIAGASRLGLKLAVASSSQREWVIDHLTRLRLIDSFDCIRCSDDVKHAKPAPDLYTSVLTALGISATQALALEDSPHGVSAAKRAGLRCVVVPNSLTQGLPFDQADLKLDSLAALPLEQLLAKFG